MGNAGTVGCLRGYTDRFLQLARYIDGRVRNLERALLHPAAPDMKLGKKRSHKREFGRRSPVAEKNSRQVPDTLAGGGGGDQPDAQPPPSGRRKKLWTGPCHARSHRHRSSFSKGKGNHRSISSPWCIRVMSVFSRLTRSRTIFEHLPLLPVCRS